MERFWYSQQLTFKSLETFPCSYFQVPWEVPSIEAQIIKDPENLDKLFETFSPCGCHPVVCEPMCAVYKSEKLDSCVAPFYGDDNYIWAIWVRTNQEGLHEEDSPILMGRIINSSFFEVKGLVSKNLSEFVERVVIESHIYQSRFLFACPDKLNEAEKLYISKYEEAEKKYFDENKDCGDKVEKAFNSSIKVLIAIKSHVNALKLQNKENED